MDKQNEYLISPRKEPPPMWAEITPEPVPTPESVPESEATPLPIPHSPEQG